MSSSKENLTNSPLRRRVAITGMGIVSCIGSTLLEVTRSLQEGRSGIGLDEERIHLGFRSALTGQIKDFDHKRNALGRKMLRTMCEPAQYAYVATMNALQDSQLKIEDLQNERAGVVFGNDSCIKPAVESIDIMRKHKETHFIGSGYIFRAMNSTVTMNLAKALGVQGANWTIAGACASGAHAIGQGLMLIRSGLQDIVVTGGAQEINWQSMASFDTLKAFSTRMEEPEKASRPFDADRDGLVPSGGAACLILEELDHARQRGAKIYGVIEGYGFSSFCGAHLSEPDAQGATRAMRMALVDGSLSPEKVDYINAHATSTPAGDLAEAQAISTVFGSEVPVSSTKSMTGHECWMAGASEVLYTTLMAKESFIAPNINFVKLQEDGPQINVVAKRLQKEIKFALSNSFGFGGTNASILLQFKSL